MAKIAPYFRIQELDANGNPLSSGKIHTYEAGTTTLKTTYQDVGEIASNTNPIILDATGSCDIYLSGGSYKFVITDSADNIIKTIDNIVGDSSNSFNGSVISSAVNMNVTSSNQNNFINISATAEVSLLPASVAGEGFTFSVKNSGSGTVTITPDGSDLIDSSANLSLSPKGWVILTSDGTNWFVLQNETVKNNYSATAAPTVNEDSDDGYSIGSKWYDETGDEAYVCLDSAVGAAVWVNTTLSLDDLGSMATQNTDDFYTKTQIDAMPKVLGFGSVEDTDLDSTTTLIPYDTTIPQSTEGEQILSLTYTRVSATSKLIVRYGGYLSASAGSVAVLTLFDGGTDAVSAMPENISVSNSISSVSAEYVTDAAATGDITFTLRFGSNVGTCYINGSGALGSAPYGGVAPTYLSVTEVEV